MNDKIKTNLDTNFLKLIGIVTMAADHAGKMLFPEDLWLQVIGRLAFPIFAYCLVVGSLYTHNVKKYMLRLGISAVLFQVAYTITLLPRWQDTFLVLNIFFSLLVGLICIIGIKEKKWWLLAIGILMAFFLNIDYGPGGVLLMVTFYLFRNKPWLSALLVLPQLLFMQMDRHTFMIFLSLQSWSVFSMPLLYFRTNFNLKINKYVFYVFYPAHFLVLYLISLVVYG